jgi:hypothetical protein
VEGLGVGYRREVVDIEMSRSGPVTAFTYLATLIDPDLRPFDWYREHVLRGAREHMLPGSYLAALQSVEIVPDTDAQRRRRELSIYGHGS